MEEEGSGIRLSKRFNDKEGEVDYKTKAGTAWSHNFLNQKPWHPLSYPNQRRKWIAEQTHAQRERRAEEISREYAQEQEFFRQTALVSKKEKEKMEMMKAVSFMYVRPPGYNPESAKAAEVADEAKQQGHDSTSQDTSTAGASTSGRPEGPPVQEKKKPRPKDVFGRTLPTEEEFAALKNAPKMETGIAGRAKPFGIEIRNVKCVRCGAFGHQSGDRECPLKDAIMPNEESRIKRDDPLTAIQAQTDASEPLKWELKQKPGLSPPRGGFKLDDPNQQIVAEEIFDEYGGFLTGDNIPDLLANFSVKPKKKKKSSKSKHRRRSSPARTDLRDHRETSSSSDDDRGRALKKKKHKKSRKHSESSEDSDRHTKDRHRHSQSSRVKRSESSSEDADNDRLQKRSDKYSRKWSSSPKCLEYADNDRLRKRSDKHRRRRSSSPERSVDADDRHRKRSDKHSRKCSSSPDCSEDADSDRHKISSDKHRRRRSSSPEGSVDADNDRHQKRSDKHRRRRSNSPDRSVDADNDRHRKRSDKQRRRRSSSPEHSDSDKERRKKTHHRHHRSQQNHADYSRH